MIAFTSIATMAYFTIESRLTALEHQLEMTAVDITSNTEFRILWPRGQLGALPADARQDMLLEALDRDIAELRELQENVQESEIKAREERQKRVAAEQKLAQYKLLLTSAPSRIVSREDE